jgi:hypothetical protein
MGEVCLAEHGRQPDEIALARADRYFAAAVQLTGPEELIETRILALQRLGQARFARARLLARRSATHDLAITDDAAGRCWREAHRLNGRCATPRQARQAPCDPADTPSRSPPRKLASRRDPMQSRWSGWNSSNTDFYRIKGTQETQ